MNACPSWLDGTTDPITRCLPMRLFWTGIQRLSRYPPSRPFSCPNYELPLFFLVLILVFVILCPCFLCDSGPSLESSGSYEAVHLTFMFTRHGMISKSTVQANLTKKITDLHTRPHLDGRAQAGPRSLHPSFNVPKRTGHVQVSRLVPLHRVT
ncbi:hypothetical protein HDV62DRAFT_377537 [Trichoderma sp. SZMC 28011]